MKLAVAAMAIVFHLGIALRAHAQEQPREAGVVEDVGITTIYLKDEKGNLVPVPGFSYEHYRDLVLKAGGGAGDPPAFSIEKLILKGSQAGDVCQFEADAVIHVRKPGWVMVPLRMPRAALRGGIVESVEPEGVKGEVEFIHRYDAKEGHVVWLGGAKERRHTLRFPLALRLGQATDEEQLTLTLPKASESRLMLEVPGLVEKGDLKAGEGVLEIRVREGRSQLDVLGASGDLALAWNPDRPDSANLLDLAIASEIDVNVETRDTIGIIARLKASRPGGVVRKLLVRLPPQTELTSRPAKDFKVAMATAEDLAEAGLDQEKLAKTAIVRVDFDRPAEAGEAILEVSYKAEGGRKQTPLELGGFEVLGAGRQTGFVSIHLPAGWSLKATPSASAFRTDDVPSLPGSPARPSTRYRFLRQPFSLQAELSPQAPRTVVEPTYFAVVQPQRVILTAKLDYRVRGATPAFVEFDCGDWQLDSVGPEQLVEVESSEPGQHARLKLLLETSGDFALEMQLHRDVPADGVELAFGLPRAIATQTLPATFAIITADNVTLTPQSDELRSLVADSRPPPFPSAPGGRALVYRELPAAAELPRFVASFQVRQRRVTATIEGRAQLGSQRANLEQRLSLQVAYEPLASLLLEAPADAQLGDLKVTQNGQLLDVQEAPGAAMRRWRIELLNPATGSVDLTVRYSVPLKKGKELLLPLLAPAEEKGVVIAGQRLVIESRTSTHLTLGPRHRDDPGLSVVETASGLTLSWPRSGSSVELERSPAAGASSAALRIERQWLQTWLSPGVRSDRFVAKIAGVQQQLEVMLPRGVTAEDVRVLVDGEPPANVKIDSDLLTLSVASTSHDVRTLEVWYQLPAAAPSQGPRRQTVELPRVARAATPLQSWVQVLTTEAEQVLYSTSPVTPQQTWRKQGWFWRRSGALTTGELETWLDASRSEGSPSDTSESLFMSLGSLESLEVVVWGRRWLWVCVAGSTFAAALLAWYLSRGRSLVLMGALTGAGLIASLLAPELALNVSQYAGVGLLLFIAAAWSWRLTGEKAGERAAPAASTADARRQPRAAQRPPRLVDHIARCRPRSSWRGRGRAMIFSKYALQPGPRSLFSSALCSFFISYCRLNEHGRSRTSRKSRRCCFAASY